ncbi:MAG TPA: hypothetical protein VFP71_04395 [Candidatus Angelobacter sp.]|nr:hypothetical protein [Candidatus Angelobacter sp.]
MSLRIRLALSLCCFLIGLAALAQSRPGGGGGVGPVSRTGNSGPPPDIPTANAMVVRGKVVLNDGTVVTEPIPIERVCNGQTRREGYTDFKGNFEFALDQETVGGRDASEAGRDVFQNSGNRGPTQGQDVDYGVTPSPSRGSDAIRPELLGCELRASLAGFKTSSVMIRTDGSSWSLNVGTIVLTPMDSSAVGAVISKTTLGAPQSAREAYEKGQKLMLKSKLTDSEKELSKAVAQYANFAAAWSLLGEVQREQSKFPAAKESYQHAITSDPKFVNPYYGMAIISVHEQNWPDVLKYTDQITKLNPDLYPLAQMYNGAANYYLGNYDVAATSVTKFEQLDVRHQNPESSLLLSNILLAKHDYDGAAKSLQNYLKVAPNAPNAAAVQQQLKELQAMNVANGK